MFLYGALFITTLSTRIISGVFLIKYSKLLNN